jgi:hypothetical protein
MEKSAEPILDDREVLALEERVRTTRDLTAELVETLAEIRRLQKRRCQIEAQIRQITRLGWGHRHEQGEDAA